MASPWGCVSASRFHRSGKVTTVAVGQGPRKLVVQGGAKRSVDGGGAKVSIANFAFNRDSITISSRRKRYLEQR